MLGVLQGLLFLLLLSSTLAFSITKDVNDVTDDVTDDLIDDNQDATWFQKNIFKDDEPYGTYDQIDFKILQSNHQRKWIIWRVCSKNHFQMHKNC